MDYKEKYEMALEGIQEILGSGEDSIKMSRLQLRLQGIFPELKESEDEKIRKAIHIYLDWLDGRKDYAPKGEYTIKDMIAWLEKQGGHANFRNKIQVGDKVTRNEDGVLVNLSQLNRVAKKQGEQKPTDKVEPSVFKDKLLELFQRFRLRCKDHILTNGEILEYVDAHIQELICTMQKSSWSEEDEVRFESCIKVLQTSDGHDTINAKWLKFLKERIGCEVNCTTIKEWSVEDKSKIQRICKYLDEAKKYYADITEVRECIDWLKSLRPQNTWKPSDEQMKALANALSLAKNCGEESAFDLGTLQDDLKRLLKI